MLSIPSAKRSISLRDLSLSPDSPAAFPSKGSLNFGVVIGKPPPDVRHLRLVAADDRRCVIVCDTWIAAPHPTTTIFRLSAKARASLILQKPRTARWPTGPVRGVLRASEQSKPSRRPWTATSPAPASPR